MTRIVLSANASYANRELQQSKGYERPSYCALDNGDECRNPSLALQLSLVRITESITTDKWHPSENYPHPRAPYVTCLCPSLPVSVSVFLSVSCLSLCLITANRKRVTASEADAEASGFEEPYNPPVWTEGGVLQSTVAEDANIAAGPVRLLLILMRHVTLF
jgi:hypothetical protein